MEPSRIVIPFGPARNITSSSKSAIHTVSDEGHLPIPTQREIAELRQELDVVIKRQDWKTATLLKDRIATLKCTSPV